MRFLEVFLLAENACKKSTGCTWQNYGSVCYRNTICQLLNQTECATQACYRLKESNPPINPVVMHGCQKGEG